MHLFCSEIGSIIYSRFTLKPILLPCKVFPFTRVFEALYVCWRQLNLSEFLWEMFGALWVIELRLVWRWLLLLIDCIPVDARKPWVRHNLFCIRGSRSKSCLRILVKKLRTNVTGVVAKERKIKSGFTVFNISEELLFIFIIERRLSAKHFVNDTAK